MFLKIEEQSRNNIHQLELENIFTEMLSNNSTQTDVLKERLSALGYDHSRYHKSICVSFDIERNKRPFFRDKVRLLSAAKDKCVRLYGNVMCGTVNDCFVSLIPDIESQDETEKSIYEIMKAAAGSRAAINMYGGIGSSREGIDTFYDSVHESLQIVRAMKIFSLHWQVKNLYQMLPVVMILDVRDRKQLYKYRNPIVDPLYISSAAKGSGNADLANTLEMYLKYGRNAKLTAEKMYIHRNTLNMRLRKIEELIGVDLSDPEKCLELQFAIYVRKCLLLG